MAAIEALLTVILPVFLVIAAGYVATWRGLFPPATVQGVMDFATGFAVPALLFGAIARLDLGTALQPGLLLAFYVAAGTCFTLGILGARALGRETKDAVVIGFACLFSNTVLLGLPINERAYGPAGLEGVYAIVAFHAPFCYLLGTTAMAIAQSSGRGAAVLAQIVREMARNPLVIAIALGFAVNLTGLGLPQVAWDAVDLLARAALPAALFGLGGILVQYKPEGDMRVIAWICTVSLIVHPLITFGIGRAMDVPHHLFAAGVLTASMAPGVNAYIFANLYGRAKRVAASAVLVATASSILTAWAWLVILGDPGV